MIAQSGNIHIGKTLCLTQVTARSPKLMSLRVYGQKVVVTAVTATVALPAQIHCAAATLSAIIGHYKVDSSLFLPKMFDPVQA